MNTNTNMDLDSIDYQSLSPDGRERYVFKRLQKMLHENPDGLTKSEIREATPFARKTVDKHMERLVALNEAYVRRKGGMDLFYPNGRLLHSNAEWETDINGKTFKLTLLQNMSGQSVFLQDLEEDDFGESAKGGILIPRENFDDFVDWLDATSEEVKEFDREQQ